MLIFTPIKATYIQSYIYVQLLSSKITFYSWRYNLEEKIVVYDFNNFR